MTTNSRAAGVPPSGAEHSAPEIGFGRRLLALIVDWVIASLISAGFFDYHPMATLGVFAGITIIMLATLGASPGHRLLGLRVYRIASGTSPIGLLQAVLRTLAVCLVLPPLVVGPDGRGMHDAWAGTFLAPFSAGRGTTAAK